MPKGIPGVHRATYVCQRCGRSFERYASQAKPHAFCSKACYAASIIGTHHKGRGFTPEAREKARQAATGRANPKLAALARLQTRDKSPRWKGDQVLEGGGRKRAEALYALRPCEVCEAEPAAIRIERHHRDGNPLNNEPSNIAFLCSKHHKEAHRGGQNANHRSD